MLMTSLASGKPHSGSSCGVSPGTENPAIDKKSVPEGVVDLLKTATVHMLTAKGVEVSKKPVRTKIVVFPRHAPVSSISCSTAVAQPSSSCALSREGSHDLSPPKNPNEYRPSSPPQVVLLSRQTDHVRVTDNEEGVGKSKGIITVAGLSVYRGCQAIRRATRHLRQLERTLTLHKTPDPSHSLKLGEVHARREQRPRHLKERLLDNTAVERFSANRFLRCRGPGLGESRQLL